MIRCGSVLTTLVLCVVLRAGSAGAHTGVDTKTQVATATARRELLDFDYPDLPGPYLQPAGEASNQDESSEGSVELSVTEDSSATEGSTESSSNQMPEESSSAEVSTTTGAVHHFDIVRLLTSIHNKRRLLDFEEPSEDSAEVSGIEESYDTETSIEDSSAQELSEASEESSSAEVSTTTGASFNILGRRLTAVNRKMLRVM